MASPQTETSQPLVTKDELWRLVVPCVSFTFLFGLFCAYWAGTVLCYVLTVVAFAGTMYTTALLLVINRHWKEILFKTLLSPPTSSYGPSSRAR